MKIKRYIANTEKEAIEKVRDDLGNDALIISVKNIKPKGIYRLFKKSSVEVTAAIDNYLNNNQDMNSNLKKKYATDEGAKSENKNDNDNEKGHLKNIENKINELERLLQSSLNKIDDKQVVVNDQNNNNEKNLNSVLQIFYAHLIENDVEERIARKLLENLENCNINEVVAKLYQRLVNMIGNPEPIINDKQGPQIVTFIGPTGVGKTTTIAKIATKFALNKDTKVGFITSDTYRIAAVEQLKVYANILSIPIQVIYSHNELASAIERFSDRDIIFFDTAGRSHKNNEQFEQLKDMLDIIKNNEIHLVLSLTLKLNDMKTIIERYIEITNFNIIFTKADETSSLGNIVNIKELYGLEYSYLTFGQNVPDDIQILDPQIIAKSLLGGADI